MSVCTLDSKCFSVPAFGSTKIRSSSQVNLKMLSGKIKWGIPFTNSMCKHPVVHVAMNQLEMLS